MRLMSSVIASFTAITLFLGGAAAAEADIGGQVGDSTGFSRVATGSADPQFDPPPVPPGCVADIDLTRYPNRAGIYRGGGACRECERFGNFGIMEHWWTDFKCWMTANGSYLTAELWTNGPR